MQLLNYEVESRGPLAPVFTLTFDISRDLTALRALRDLLHLNLQLSIDAGTVTMSVRAHDLRGALNYVDGRVELAGAGSLFDDVASGPSQRGPLLDARR